MDTVYHGKQTNRLISRCDNCDGRDVMLAVLQASVLIPLVKIPPTEESP